MSHSFQPAFALKRNASLVLADGAVFLGYGIGAAGVTAGELCFTTGMSGYQETLTDPSFAGQIITFTFPHIGNVGCNEEDVESQDSVKDFSPNAECRMLNAHRGACGLIIREAITEPSNFRSSQHLNDWLIARGITGISGIDTRQLTAHLRTYGAQNGVIVYDAGIVGGRQQSDPALSASHCGGQMTEAGDNVKKLLAAAPDMNGLELAAAVSRSAAEEWHQGLWSLGDGFSSLDSALSTLDSPHIIAIDYGMKHTIARNFVALGATVTIVPARTQAKEILALKPHGVFLSNGPGDPAATGNYAVPIIQEVIAAGIPVFGICLGHQLLGLALGANTEKMAQGHRGANHPIKNLATGKVEITAQNHGFAVSKTGLPSDIEVTHISLFDGTIAGIKHKSKPVFSVQYHPESSPGPHDSRYLFAQFMAMMKKSREGRVESRVEGKIV